MKGFLSVVLISIGLLIFAAAGGGAASDEVVEAKQMEDEPIEDDHMEDEDMEDEHMEDEHMEDEHKEDEDEHQMDQMDQMDHMHVEAPDEFTSLTNPFAGDTDAITAGQEIYEINCRTCHGPEGAGDGPGAVGLDPKPANLSDSEMMHDLSDGYLFWRVSKGGYLEPFNSHMP
ncbi:MAG: c-type cytochrome, partial [Candidatus Promineifilaceae bacterium]